MAAKLGGAFLSFGSDAAGAAETANGTTNLQLKATANSVAFNGATNAAVSLTNVNNIAAATATFSGLVSASTAPSADAHLCNKSYVDSVAEGLDAKGSCRAGTTGALSGFGAYDNGAQTFTESSPTGALTIDGIVLVTGDRLLVKDQATGAENGIYSVSNIDGSSAVVLTRADDMNENTEVAGAYSLCREGTVNGNIGFVVTSPTSDTDVVVGTTAVTFTEFSGVQTITAGNGLAKTENTLAVNVDGTGIEINSDALRLKDSGVTTDKIANDAVTLAKMANITRGHIIVGNSTEAPTLLNAAGSAKLLIGDGNDLASVTMSGDVAIDNAGATTIQADAVESGMLNDNVISGQTELAHADIVDADEMMISDGGVLKKVGVDSLRDHFFGVVSGDATIADGGALTIAATAVEHSMLNNNVISGLIALGSAGVAQVDELMFSDAGTLKKVTFSNFEDSIFANISGDATIAAGGALTIGADAVQTGMLHDDCATGLAGAGLTATTGVLNIISGANTGLNVAADAMNLDMNDLSEAAISVANDSFAFVDADDSNATKKESIADLMAAVAGDAITASAGVLAVGVDGTGIEINSDALRLKDDGVTYTKLQDSTQGFAVLGRSASTGGGHDEIAFTQAGAVLARNYTGNLQASTTPEVASLTVGTATEQVKLSATGTNGANGQLQLNVASGTRSLTMSGNINVGGNFTLSNNDFTINAVAAGKTLAMNESLTIGDGFNGTLTFGAGGKTLTVSENVTLNQDLSTSANVTFADVTVSSDIKLKENIQTIENGLDIVNQMVPVTWDWKSNGSSSAGIIAQQIEAMLPDLVKDSPEKKSVNYNGLHGYLISAIQELSKQVNELKQ